jgi:hypothetical protein
MKRLLRGHESDASYFKKRATQETAAAEAAASHAAKAPHRRLAERYALLAAYIDEVQHRLD